MAPVTAVPSEPACRSISSARSVSLSRVFQERIDLKIAVYGCPSIQYVFGMPNVSFTPHLRQHLSCPDTSAPGSTVAEVLAHVFETSPKLRSYLLDDQGAVRKHVTIFVNTQSLQDRQRLSDAVGEGDEIFVFQALSGG